MFQNYVVVAFRHILKHRLYSMINIVGLAVGMTACLFIFLFVRFETSYDDWMDGADNIYRLNYTNFYKNGEHFVCACAPGIAKSALDRRFPEIEHSSRMIQLFPVITQRDKSFQEPVWVAESNIFQTLNLNFVVGDDDVVFDELASMVLSEKMAQKYFGDVSPIGEVFTFEQTATGEDGEQAAMTRDFMVTGVFQDIPENSEFDFEFIVPLDHDFYQYTNPVNARWYNTWGFLYFKLKDGTDPAVITSQLEDLVAKEVPPIDDRTPNQTIELSIVNLKDAHLNSEDKNFGTREPGSITQVYTFSVVAVLILLIACINFMNLSTARSMQRAKEISMRKVLGANRAQLIRQFLGENILIATIGLLLAGASVSILLPSFNELAGLSLSFAFWSDPILILTGIGLILLIGLVAGLYPAFYLTAFRPSDVLASGSPGGYQKGSSFRTALTIFQFAISIALIISTAVVYGQNIYSMTKDLGYEEENKMVLRGINADYARGFKDTLATEIERLPDVEAITMSQAVPADSIGWHNGFTLMDEAGAEQKAISGVSIDENFFDIYDIPLLFGRNFEEGRVGDMIVPTADGERATRGAAILNETSARQLGFTNAQDAVGRMVEWFVPFEIVGVVSDFHFNSTRTPMKSLVYIYFPTNFSNITIDYKDGTDTAKLNQDIERIWNSLIPDVNARYDYIEDRVAVQYVAETRQGQMLLAFSVLAIIVACLGLYGLAAFTAEQRTKEIAVRKVHGAGVWDIVKIMLIQFSKPVLIANVIAWPVAWYFMSDYLNGFTFRIDLGLPYFIITGLLALLIAWLTTTQHAIKAARTSPAVVLKSE